MPLLPAAPLMIRHLQHLLKTLYLSSDEGVLTQLSKVGKVANPARGQLNRKNDIVLCAHSRLRIWPEARRVWKRSDFS